MSAASLLPASKMYQTKCSNQLGYSHLDNNYRTQIFSVYREYEETMRGDAWLMVHAAV